jgi:hypothetical protein
MPAKYHFNRKLNFFFCILKINEKESDRDPELDPDPLVRGADPDQDPAPDPFLFS